MKKYLSLGAVLAGSALMVSCDGDDVTVVEDSGVADAIANLDSDIGTKPVAPIPLAEYPLTSLKLAFDNAPGGCSAQTFSPGDELELDFDTINLTSLDAQADWGFDGTIVFGISTTNAFVENIVNGTDSFTIENIYAGTDNDGELLLSDLTFTPLASDLRSVTGSFEAIGTEEATVDQITTNVFADNGDLGGSGLTFEGLSVTSATLYEDASEPVEILSFSNVVVESGIGDGNLVLSLAYGDDCEVLFLVPRASTDDFVVDGSIVVGADFEDFLDDLELEDILVLDPTVDQIEATVAEALHLITGADGTATITGSYRHDFDSSVGTAETIIDSSAGVEPRRVIEGPSIIAVN